MAEQEAERALPVTKESISVFLTSHEELMEMITKWVWNRASEGDISALNHLPGETGLL